MESQVFKDEVLLGAESAEQPAEQMSERHDHVKNVTETSRIQLCAKSFILQVYGVLARHNAKPVLDVSQDGPHNQIESNRAIGAEVMESETGSA